MNSASYQKDIEVFAQGSGLLQVINLNNIYKLLSFNRNNVELIDLNILKIS